MGFISRYVETIFLFAFNSHCFVPSTTDDIGSSSPDGLGFGVNSRLEQACRQPKKHDKENSSANTMQEACNKKMTATQPQLMRNI